MIRNSTLLFMLGLLHPVITAAVRKWNGCNLLTMFEHFQHLPQIRISSRKAAGVIDSA